MRRQEDPNQLIANTLGANLNNGGGMRAQSTPGFFVNFILENRCKPNRTEHSQPVLGKALLWFSDRSHQLRFNISAAAHVIDHPLSDGIKEHPVNGEITALGIFFGG